MVRRSMVLRVWTDEEGRMQGQISDPLTGWQRQFDSPEELWAAITWIVGGRPSIPPDDPGRSEPEI